MKLRNLLEIRDAEIYFDEIRWMSDPPFSDLDDAILRELREDVSETIRALEGWQRRRLRDENRNLVKRVKAKLLDFQWEITEVLQQYERVQAHWRRVERIWDPEPGDELYTPWHYGVKKKLKATPFYRQIHKLFNPVPLEEY